MQKAERETTKSQQIIKLSTKERFPLQQYNSDLNHQGQNPRETSENPLKELRCDKVV